MNELYAALAAVGFVASQIVLLEWVGEFNAKYDSDNDGEFALSGIWLIDMLLQFFDDASNNYAAVRLYDTVVRFVSGRGGDGLGLFVCNFYSLDLMYRGMN